MSMHQEPPQREGLRLTSPSVRLRRALQEEILDQVKASTGARDAEVAAWAGVERSLVSRWRNGEREMGLLELLGLIRGCGDAVPVLRGLAAAGDCDITRRAEHRVDIEDGSLELSEQASRLAREAHRAMADGTLTTAEREQLRRTVDELHELLHRIESTVSPNEGR